MFFGLNDVAFLGSLQPPALWTPADITTALWLDAADASTITESGGAVSQWNDKSGNARHATASSTTEPTYGLTSFNGKPGISSNGSSQFMTQSAESYDTQWFGVVFVKTTASAFLFGAGDLNPAAVIQTSADIRVGLPPNQAFTGFTNAPGILCSNKLLATWNGASMTAGLTQSSSMSLHIGARFGNSIFYDGAIAEIVVLTTSYSDNERQKLEGYFAHKWGLTADLPNDHPYKTSAPTV
jgi:hypothetical protein